jgi:hypothetical protein
MLFRSTIRFNIRHVGKYAHYREAVARKEPSTDYDGFVMTVRFLIVTGGADMLIVGARFDTLLLGQIASSPQEAPAC